LNSENISKKRLSTKEFELYLKKLSGYENQNRGHKYNCFTKLKSNITLLEKLNKQSMKSGFQVKTAQNGVYMMPILNGKTIEEEEFEKDFEEEIKLVNIKERKHIFNAGSKIANLLQKSLIK
jgi:hypothetical protein